jgi:hypothetical protein
VIGGFDDDDLTFDRTSVCVRMSSQWRGTLEEHFVVIVRTLFLATGSDKTGRQAEIQRGTERERVERGERKGNIEV